MEKIIETNQCKKCSDIFKITDKDLEFYDRVSPIFNGKKYPIPSPTFCPECRQQRRLIFRNERSLYKRKCDATGENIISIYSPDKKYKVYSQDFWWSDKWDAMNYGKEFNFNENFFEQFNKLINEVPKISTFIIGSENCSYNNILVNSKNCYYTFAGAYLEKTYYSYWVGWSENVFDSYKLYHSNNIYNAIDSEKCNNSYFIQQCENCSNCYHCKKCIGCNDCISCIGLNNKQYCIGNKQYTKEEYIKKSTNLTNLEKIKIFDDLYSKTPNMNLDINQCENVIGDKVKQSNNSFHIYDCERVNKSKYTTFGLELESSYDTDFTSNCDFIYETIGGLHPNKTLFTMFSNEGNNILYCFYSNSCNNCFGCVGLKNKQYCILNKQYTKQEYNILVPKIIEHMKSTGEWGEFFPSSISPFGYNETVANEYFPLSKEEALERGFNWTDYESPIPNVEKIIPASKLPEDIADIPDYILAWAIECEVTKKPFRIIKSELEFYRKHNLPIPHKHPDQRHKERMSLRNPRKLFDRKCDKCGVDMKSTYSPDREELVYCEGCYNKEIY